jgi:hypothetical protein
MKLQQTHNKCMYLDQNGWHPLALGLNCRLNFKGRIFNKDAAYLTKANVED